MKPTALWAWATKALWLQAPQLGSCVTSEPTSPPTSLPTSSWNDFSRACVGCESTACGCAPYVCVCGCMCASYFNGEYPLEEIVTLEEQRSEDLRELLSKFQRVLCICEHECNV